MSDGDREAWKEAVLDRIQSRIKEIGTTQRKVAAAAGVTESAVSQWMADKTEPDWWALRAICETLDTNADYVMGFTKNPLPSGNKTPSLVVSFTTPVPSQEYDAEPAPLVVNEGGLVPVEQTPSAAWIVSQLPALCVPVPMLMSHVAAGSPIIPAEAVQGIFFMPISYLQHEFVGPLPPGRIVLVRVAEGPPGDSMKETIWPGAILMLDRGPDCQGITEFTPGDIYLVRYGGGFAVKRVWLTGGELNIHSDNRTHPPFTIPLERGDLDEIRHYLPARVHHITNPSHP